MKVNDKQLFITRLGLKINTDEDDVLVVFLNIEMSFNGERAIASMIPMLQVTFIFKMISKAKIDDSTKLMHCITEIDGIRVLGLNGIFFISKLAESIYNSCCLKTKESPPKQLLINFQNILEDTIKFDQVTKELHNLQEALNEIYHTALYTLTSAFQSLLLQVIYFAKIVFVAKQFDTEVFFQKMY